MSDEGPTCKMCGDQITIDGAWACNNCIEKRKAWLAAFDELVKDHPIVRKAKDFEDGGTFLSEKDQGELNRVMTAHGMGTPEGSFPAKPGYTSIGIAGGKQCPECQTYLLDAPAPSLKFDNEGGTFSYPTREEMDSIVMGVGGTDQINIKPAGEVKKVFLKEGVVVDAVCDGGHLEVRNSDRHDLLHDILNDLEGKKVRIMIEVVDDDDGL